MALRIASLLFLALLAACNRAPEPDACRAITFEGSRFTACPARPGRHRIRLVLRGKDGQPLRSLARVTGHLGLDGKRIVFAMNAGMYDDTGLPIGLYVEDGRPWSQLNRRDGPGNFHLKPNGVFWGDATGWHVATTNGYAATPRHGVDFATQSGPMLVIDGKLHPGFAADGASLHVRNGVGVDASGNVWVAISHAPISFGRFARLFRDQLHTPNALYLDGTVSQLWDQARDRPPNGIPLGPIVVALRKD